MGALSISCPYTLNVALVAGQRSAYATTLYQMTGLSFMMTGQGSHTPTQLLCRQVGSVCGVQSSMATFSSCPVPCRHTTRGNGIAHALQQTAHEELQICMHTGTWESACSCRHPAP